jgi:hypothetical protein
MTTTIVAAAAAAAAAGLLLSAAAGAATQTLYDTTFVIPPSAAPGTPGSAFYETAPLVVSSRGTLTAQIQPGVFGAAIQNLSFNLMTSSATLPLQYSGPSGWSGTLEVDPGTYFGVASGTTAPTPGALSQLGFFGLRIEFTPSTTTVVPLPAAAWLLAAALGMGGLFGRRRRAPAELDAPSAIRT